MSMNEKKTIKIDIFISQRVVIIEYDIFCAVKWGLAEC